MLKRSFRNTTEPPISAMHKLLLVEDEPLLVETLKHNLTQHDYIVDVATDGAEADFMLAEFDYDLVILDLGLPKKPGLAVLTTFRQRQQHTPVLILTARNAWQERVEGLKQGADDYLGKPFHFEELLARIEVLLKRPAKTQDKLLKIGAFSLNLDTRELRHHDQTHALTRTEFGLARILLSHPNKVFSKDKLMQKVTDQHYDRESNVIEVYIRKLRQYMGKATIETLRGQGYRFVQPEDEAQ